MQHKQDAYFTVEASFILPMVLVLYWMIILAALYLYCRCSISMDNYLLAMREARFTHGASEYGEVIYAQEKDASMEGYVEQRLQEVRRFYPYFQVTESSFSIDKTQAAVSSKGRGYERGIEKTFMIENPVEIIRGGRRR